MKKEFSTIRLVLASLVLSVLLLLGTNTIAADWPTHLHDNYRSGTTTEQLPLPLSQSWVNMTTRRPKPAWTETPALQDFWQNTYGHKSRVPVENAFRVAVAGDLLYYGSSNSDKLICIDADSGVVRWKFFADGPIRYAPTVAAGKVYCGSDDGYVYCLNAASGTVLWKHRAVDSDELIYANGRMVSVSPVRTSVLVDNGVAYWGTGLFSGAQTGLARFLCAYNAHDGEKIWKITPAKPIQGYLLCTANNLYTPAGKSSPTYYRKSDGAYLGSFGSSRQGGAYALISSDNKFYYGPHYSGSGSYIGKYDANTRNSESVAWGAGNHLVVAGDYSYYSSDTTIVKINRSTKKVVWTAASRYPYELILAGNTLFAGGNDELAAFDSANGAKVWTAPVNGKACGLAVANGALFVSTDLGSIHAFRAFDRADLNQDGFINMLDYGWLAMDWLGCTDPANKILCHDITQ